MMGSWRLANYFESAKVNWRVWSKFRIVLASELVILITSAFILMTANASFWRRLSVGVGEFSQAWPSYFAVAAFLLAFISLFLALVPRILLKPVLSVILIASASAAYFMDSYGAVIDRHALQSVFESTVQESTAWLSSGMLVPILLIGLLPVVVLWRFVELKRRTLKPAIGWRLLFAVGCAGVAAGVLMLNFQTFSSLGRNHAVLRDLLNPVNVINALRGHLKSSFVTLPSVMRPIGADVKRGSSYSGAQKPIVFVYVLGESVRAANFGLLGYARGTTPELAKHPLSVFTDVASCGTNTATSVPCMFSNLGRKNYDQYTANTQDNLLDVIHRAGYSVVWFDNQTGSKKVARRFEEVDLSRATDPVLCAGDSCYDEILLKALDERIKTIKSDTVIVLHQLGNHGPAYFQRTPPNFRKFQPICESVEPQNCSHEALVNSYDNAILYTDFILSETIKRLAARPEFDSLMLYVSDHGQSMGESGFYLHGAPYAIAPVEQTHVPMFLWQSPQFSARRNFDMDCINRARTRPTSHDALFPMLLNVLDLQTSAYESARDPLAGCGANIAR